MKDKSQNGSAPERPPQSAKDLGLVEPDELVKFAQEYFSSDFPNNERLGCPTTGTLDRLVTAGKVPDDLLRAHLFCCSECFREYRAAILARHEHPSRVGASSWSHRLATMFKRLPAPIYAGAIALILLSMVSLYFWRGRHGEPAPKIIRTESPTSASVNDVSPGTRTLAPNSPVAESSSSTPEKSSAVPRGQRVPSESNQGELLAMITVVVDLETFSAVRGKEESGEGRKSIRLTPPRTRLNLKLPNGSAAGRYDLSIVNPAGETLVTTKAVSANGVQLSAVLNLQKIAPGSYLLRLTRAGEVPGYYPVIIKE